MKNVKAFALELKDAYSTPAYAGGWSACIKMLRRRGYGDQAIEAVLRSKWTRWASDASNKRYGSVTSADLARFMDDSRNRIDRAAVAELVKGYGAEYWVERGYAHCPDCGGDCDALLAALKKGASVSSKYLIQARQFEELRQWDAGRYGRQSRNHYSPWRTIAKAATSVQAEEILARQSQSGMRQYRVKFEGKTVKEVGL